MYIPTVWDYQSPVAVEWYETFRGPDPWAGDVPAVWHVGGFRWGSARKHDPAKTQLARSKGKRPRGIWVGILSGDHSVRRILPDALQDLWWTQRLEARDIPWLLHRIEPLPKVEVRTSDSSGTVIFVVFWAVCAIAVIGVFAVEGTFRPLLHETAGVIALLVFFGIPAAIGLLFWSSDARQQRMKEQALTLLRERERAERNRLG